jgi:hypothetical protein
MLLELDELIAQLKTLSSEGRLREYDDEWVGDVARAEDLFLEKPESLQACLVLIL